MEKENKERLVKIIAAATLLVIAVVVSKVTNLKMWQELLLFLVPYLIVGGETLKEAAEKLLHGELLDEDFLMSVATLGALSIGFIPGAESQFPEAVFVMLFFQVGELFEDMAEDKSRDSITELMDIRPDTASVERDGGIVVVNPAEIAVGETIVIKPGEKVPLDGVVLEGASSLDTVALTGESVPRGIGVGDSILSGCVNLSGVLRARVTKPFTESTASKILELVENASENKSKSESFITRFAKVYTPIVVALAVLLAFLPPLLSGNFSAEFAKWLYRALTFLIVSCPCALVISIPLAFFGGIGGAARKGILVKGSNYLEALARLGTVVFDKTGTLTEGVFEVTAVHPETIDEKELLHLAAHVERYSTHPVAISLRLAYPDEADSCSVENVEEVAGQGVKAKVNGKTVCVGNSKMMEAIGVTWKDCEKKGTIVHDHDRSYYTYGAAHQECLAHVLKYLVGAAENEPGLKWHKQMHSLIQKMIHVAKRFPKGIPKEKVRELTLKYEAILDLAQEEYAHKPPDKAYLDGFNLQRRLREYQEAHLFFLSHPWVDYPNNISERELRKFKRKQKQAVVLRSVCGGQHICDALSIIETARMQCKNVYDIVETAFSL